MELVNLLENVLWFRLVGLFILGLCIGSFLNVVIYRLPLILAIKWKKQAQEILEIADATPVATISLSFPASHCPKCKQSIPWWTNIPLIGYLILMGRCCACNCKISARYPIVELISALLFSAVGFVYTDIWQIMFACIFIAVLIALMGIDLDTFLLPDELTLPLVWIGLLVNLNGMFSSSLESSLFGAVIGYMSLWSIYWIFKLITGKDGMGYGDFKLLAAIGAWLGWQCLVNVLLFSSCLGIVYALTLKMLGKLDSGKAIPFGPFLGGGALVSLLLANFIKIL
jgi:leader peptidase (prepilin peptidase)/N-methyltransferase